MMIKKYYIRKNNIITGPFERQTLIDMLNQGRLQLSDYVSTDKNFWQSPQDALNLIIPEKSTVPLPPPPTDYRKAPAAPVPPAVEMLPTYADEEIDDFTHKLSFGDLLLHIIASLGNGGGYLHRLNQYGSNTMLSAGITAAVFSLIFASCGSLLFGSCYNISQISLCIRTLVVILLAGALFWLGNTILRLIRSPEKQNNAAEADFLCAMHAMMNMGVISVIISGTVFAFNRQLFNMTIAQICTVVAVALLPLIFFSVNTILALRMNFMGNCQLKPGISSLLAIFGFYSVTVLSVLLLYAIYRIA